MLLLLSYVCIWLLAQCVRLKIHRSYIRWDVPTMIMMMTAATAATTTTTVIPHYMIILSLTFVPPAASCYKGVCHFMCSHFLVNSWLLLSLSPIYSFYLCLIQSNSISMVFQWQGEKIVIHQKAERIKGMAVNVYVCVFRFKCTMCVMCVSSALKVTSWLDWLSLTL